VQQGPPALVVADPFSAARDAAYWTGVWQGRAEAVTIAGAAYAYSTLASSELKEEGKESKDAVAGGRASFARELHETRALMYELQHEHTTTAKDDEAELAAAIERPRDGEYLGESAEDDDGDQAVSTHLTFRRDGTVVGAGHDGVDGVYTIQEGRWCNRRVAWIEEYEDGFEVALRGQVRHDGTIYALWASSRDVCGSVELRAP